MKIGIIDHIDCAHFLPGHPKCGAPHGHTYKVECVVEGDLQNGMVMDFADLKKVVHQILARYDHKSWNEFLEYPSVENICDLLHRELRQGFDFSCTLRVWEGEGKWAEL
jgi:6-pyruvoyltetrahydropterin/6-carboxytetrahydropterin synthase